MYCPVGTRRNNNVIIITLNDTATSFWRNNDVIIASYVRWDMIIFMVSS